jgi:hypothetical protein
MSTKLNNNRFGFKWSVNEVISLQREFELLGWSIDQIAEKHKRTTNAIMYKLDQEGFADYNVLYSNYHNLNALMPVNKAPQLSLHHDVDSDSDFEDDEDFEDEDDEDFEDEDEDDDGVANLSERVDNLEESISEIKTMIQQMMATSNKPTAVYKSWY